MAKKTINIFNVSFLDLLSGALAAVIILFVIVPKMDIEAKEASEKLDELGVQVAELDDMVQQLQNSIPSTVYDSIVAKMNQLVQDLEDHKKAVQDLEAAVQQLRQMMENYKQFKAWMDKCGFTPSDNCPPPQKPAPPKPVSVGFKFKGKNVVFIIDVSGSMEDEGRIRQVKAGMKMLVASMADEFRVDVVRFPYQTNDDYQANWGQLRKASKNNKDDIYQFLYGLEAGGHTPTRNVLNYVFQTYSNMTDIVLLSDGEPTANGQTDDIYNILNMVDQINTRTVQVHTIGVGSDFFNNPTDDKVVFLQQLAKRNGDGFFIDF